MEAKQNHKIPAEDSEIERYQVGTSIKGVLGGVGKTNVGVFVPEDSSEHLPLIVNCSDDAEVGSPGCATLEAEDDMIFWRFENERPGE